MNPDCWRNWRWTIRTARAPPSPRTAPGESPTDRTLSTPSTRARPTTPARRPGLDAPGFDDRSWPGGPTANRAQGHPARSGARPDRGGGDPTPGGHPRVEQGVHVVDMGRTLAGWTRLTVRAEAGTTVRLVHGERLNSDGSVLARNDLVPGRCQTDEYVCAGGGADEVWEPRFSYKGFRYVQVSGLPRSRGPSRCSAGSCTRGWRRRARSPAPNRSTSSWTGRCAAPSSTTSTAFRRTLPCTEERLDRRRAARRARDGVRLRCAPLPDEVSGSPEETVRTSKGSCR